MLYTLQLAGTSIERPQTPTVSHEEVLEVGKLKADVMKSLVAQIIATLPAA